MVDYLDNPPKRYRCFGKDDFGHPYEALTAEDADGEWVRFADMDLYMFEGAQMMKQLAADLAACKIARDGWTKASDEAYARIATLEAALTDLYGLVRKQSMDDDFRQRIETAIGSPPSDDGK